MANRVITVASALVIVGVIAYFATTTFSQSGRNRTVAATQEPTPSLSTDDVAAPAPSAAPSPSTVTNAAGPIAWKTSFAEAKRAAKPGQVIFVDVYTDWCGFCKRMDARVYTDPGVQAMAADYVFVKLNAEDGGEGEAFARQARVQGYPTLFVYSSEGRLLQAKPGAILQPNQFMAWLQQSSVTR